MKFERNNLNLVKNIEEKEVQSAVEEKTTDLNITETEPEVHVIEAETHVEETPIVEEDVKVEPMQDTLAEKFKIPEFDPSAFPKTPQGIFTRVTSPQHTVQPVSEVEKIDTAYIEGIDLVDEVSDGEMFDDESGFVEDEPSEVEEKLDADLAVAKEELAAQPAPIPETQVPEWTGNCEKCGAPEHLCTCEETPIEEPAPAPVEEEKAAEPTTEPQPEEAPKADEPTKQGAWDKLVDLVIVPTLLTCLDRAKDYIQTVLSDDLKKNTPDA